MGRFKANRRFAAVRKILEENKGRPELRGAQFDEEGCQYLGTRYYFVKIRPEHALRGVSAVKGKAMAFPKLADDFFKEGGRFRVVRIALRELKEQAAILEAAADDRTPSKPALRIGDCFFNPNYVVACMEVLGADEAEMGFDEEKAYSLIAIYAEKGTGAVAPLNKRMLDMEKFEEYVPVSVRDK